GRVENALNFAGAELGGKLKPTAELGHKNFADRSFLGVERAGAALAEKPERIARALGLVDGNGGEFLTLLLQLRQAFKALLGIKRGVGDLIVTFDDDHERTALGQPILNLDRNGGCRKLTADECC